MNQNQSEGKKAALIIGCIFIGLMLIISLFISVVQLTYRVVSFAERVAETEDNSEMEDADFFADEDTAPESGKEETPSADDEYWEGVDYYQFTDYIRDDLSYSVAFEKDEQLKADERVFVDMNYPVVSGENVTNLDGINELIQDEIEDVHNYVDGIAKELSAEDVYDYIVDGYVTYMSEDILSIVFTEYGYLNEEVAESYIVSLNIDMTTGMVMDNTQILEIDDDFSIDFRKRSEKQNGAVESLSVYSDQEITEYLNDSFHAIIFYTPLGMEVGFNFYGGWVTVTYRDYQKFLKQL